MTQEVGTPSGMAAEKRSPRLTLIVMLALCGVLWVGLLMAAYGAVFQGEWQRADLPLIGAIVVWLFIGFLLLVLPFALVMLGVSVLRPSVLRMTRTELSTGTSRRVQSRLSLQDASRIQVLPAQRTTWSGGNADPRPRLVGRSRLEPEVWVTGPDSFRISVGDRAWPGFLRELRGWAAQRPELVQDAATRSLLDGSGEEGARAGARRRGFLWLWAACAVGLPASLLLVSGSAPTLRSLPGMLLGGVVIGGIFALCLWMLFEYLGAVVGSVRARDPWHPFRPRPDGTYLGLVSGRMALLRAPEGAAHGSGGPIGLTARWVMLTVIGASGVVFPLLWVRLIHTLVEVRQLTEQLTR